MPISFHILSYSLPFSISLLYLIHHCMSMYYFDKMLTRTLFYFNGHKERQRHQYHMYFYKFLKSSLFICNFYFYHISAYVYSNQQSVPEIEDTQSLSI